MYKSIKITTDEVILVKIIILILNMYYVNLYNLYNFKITYGHILIIIKILKKE